MEIEVIDSVYEIIKVAAIVFATIHLLTALLLVREVFRMNKAVNTEYTGCFGMFSLVYLAILTLILLLIIFY